MSSFTAQPTSSNTLIVPAAAPSAGGPDQAPLKPAAQYRVPDEITFTNVCKIAITEDKPIMMDYWTASLDKSVIIGVSENKDKLLVKSEDEYTSTISKIYKVETEYIIMTENSIYIVSNDIPTKRIN